MNRRILVASGLILILTLGIATLALGYEGGLYGVMSGGIVRQFTPKPYVDANWIYFSNGIKIDTRVGEPKLSLTVEKSDYYLVHCKGPIYPEYIKTIEATGAKVYNYISNYTFLIKMDRTVKNMVEQINFVDWIGIFQPAYKISGQSEFRNLQGIRKVTILLYPDVELDNVIAFLESIGGKIIDTAESEWKKRIICEIDLSYVPAAAKLETVNWIEPWHPMEFQNSDVQWVLQTASSGNRRVWNMGIKGEGQLLSTCDSGIRTSHYAFRSTISGYITTWGDYPDDRKIIAYKKSVSSSDFGDESGLNWHGTHTAGTITGNDDGFGSSSRDGIAKKGRIYFVDAGRVGSPYVWVPSDLNDLYDMPYTGNSAGSAKIMSNSWGSDVEGAYNASSTDTDEFMWDHKDFLLFFSVGNWEPCYYVGSPATAKNCVSVGGVWNGSSYQSFWTSSSRGPCDDGRRKPTILAPAQWVYSPKGDGNTGYWGMGGTSMASPGAAGAGVLVRQYFTEGWYPSGTENPPDAITPSAALIKAMLINSADPSISGQTVPNNRIGWGRVDLDSVLHFSGDTKKLAIVDDQTGLSTGQYVEYTYYVNSNAVPFRVTLVWTDYPAWSGSGLNIRNDLNLTVTDPNSNVYKGSVYSGGQSLTGGSYDYVNVEECVRRNSPASGNWTVRVDGYSVSYSGPQPFALVITADLGTSPEYTLTINTEGNGSVEADPVGPTYPPDTPVELTAIADPGWTFDHWSGHLTGSENPKTIIMDDDKTVTAHFTQDQYTLTIDVFGYGSVTKVPDQSTYTYGTDVILTAVEDTPGWVFSVWGGDISGNDNPKTITIYDNTSVTATFVIDGHILDLSDFPMRTSEAQINEKSAAAVAQMTLDYMWWDGTGSPPVKYTQTELHTYGLDYSEADPYLDLVGMWHTIQDKKPMPYSQYGYNFTKRHNADQYYMLKLICQWIDYTIGTYGGHEDGHPYHVPAAVPTFGHYGNWMAVRGIHTDTSAYPMPDTLTIYGFWVNDPLPGGIGANSYKLIDTWKTDYYQACTTSDYYGEYLGIFEPPESVEDCKLIIPEPIVRFNDEQKEQFKDITGSDEIPEHLGKWIVQAAIDGVTEELIPFDENFKAVFNSTVPGKPMFIENKNNGDYFAVPFNLPLQPKEFLKTKVVEKSKETQDISKEKFTENTAVVILIDAEDGSFKEASWTTDGVRYLPILILEAEQIAIKTAAELGLKIKKPHPQLVHRSSTPYYPEWRVTILEEGIAIYISQDGTVSVEDIEEVPPEGSGGGTMSSGEGTTPFVYSLRPVSPNPFANNTTVSYSIARPGKVSINIYDISGRLIKTLISERKEAGVHSARWNGKDNNNRTVAAGFYFLRLSAGDFVSVNKVILVR